MHIPPRYQAGLGPVPVGLQEVEESNRREQHEIASKINSLLEDHRKKSYFVDRFDQIEHQTLRIFLDRPRKVFNNTFNLFLSFYVF